MDKPSGSKPFDQALYDKNDPKAKKISCEFLVSTGKFKLDIPIEEQPEYFKEKDIVLTQVEEDAQVGVETERKKVWAKSGRWETSNWDTVDVPFRKHTSKADIFIMLNEKWDTLAVTKMATILKKDKDGNFKFKGYKPDTTYTKDEPFFKVPLMCWRFFTFIEGKWVEVSQIGELV